MKLSDIPDNPKNNVIDYIFNFGKYGPNPGNGMQGEAFCDVWENDRGYIRWAARETKRLAWLPRMPSGELDDVQVEQLLAGVDPNTIPQFHPPFDISPDFLVDKSTPEPMVLNMDDPMNKFDWIQF
jgi:hypothetical protein